MGSVGGFVGAKNYRLNDAGLHLSVPKLASRQPRLSTRLLGGRSVGECGAVSFIGPRLLVLDHNHVVIVDGLVVTAGPVELEVWDISVWSYKLRPGRRVSFHRQGWVG